MDPIDLPQHHDIQNNPQHPVSWLKNRFTQPTGPKTCTAQVPKVKICIRLKFQKEQNVQKKMVQHKFQK